MAAQPKNVSPAQQITPAKFAHAVLRTNRFKEMVDWYRTVLHREVAYENRCLAFMTYDDEHHRLAIAAFPGITERPPHAAGLDHLAYTYGSLGDLVVTYERLKAAGITPVVAINHGITASMYYRDPDGNKVELQIDNYDNAQAMHDFFRSRYFQKPDRRGLRSRRTGARLSRRRASTSELDKLRRGQGLQSPQPRPPRRITWPSRQRVTGDSDETNDQVHAWRHDPHRRRRRRFSDRSRGRGARTAARDGRLSEPPATPPSSVPAAAAQGNAHHLPSKQVKFEAPVLHPPEFLAIGLNYADHIAESKMEKPKFPLFFNKQSTCVTGPHDPIHLPRVSKALDYEGELGIVIGQPLSSRAARSRPRGDRRLPRGQRRQRARLAVQGADHDAGQVVRYAWADRAVDRDPRRDRRSAYARTQDLGQRRTAAAFEH